IQKIFGTQRPMGTQLRRYICIYMGRIWKALGYRNGKIPQGNKVSDGDMFNRVGIIDVQFTFFILDCILAQLSIITFVFFSLVKNYKYPVQKQITAPPKDKQQADAKEEDIPSAQNDEPSEDIMKAFNTGSLLKAITKTFGAEYMLAGFFKLLSDASGF
ncbi:unnamed protein product, partial [Owenia fusiformis]